MCPVCQGALLLGCPDYKELQKLYHACVMSVEEHACTYTCVCGYVLLRDVHSVCSWDEKAAVRIQDALRNEILRFISEAQGVSVCVNTLLYTCMCLLFSFLLYSQ